MKWKHLTIHTPGHKHWNVFNVYYMVCTLVTRLHYPDRVWSCQFDFAPQVTKWAHLVTCVPFVVFWKLCVCCVWQLWARELQFRCEPASLQPVWRRRRLWRPSPGPALLLSSSFSASPSPFASHALELLLQVWSPADAAGVRRKRKLSPWNFHISMYQTIHYCTSKMVNLPCLVTWSQGFHRVLALQSCPGRSW